MFVFAKKYNELKEEYEKYKSETNAKLSSWESYVNFLNLEVQNNNKLLQRETNKLEQITLENTRLKNEKRETAGILKKYTEELEKLFFQNNKYKEMIEKLSADKATLTRELIEKYNEYKKIEEVQKAFDLKEQNFNFLIRIHNIRRKIYENEISNLKFEKLEMHRSLNEKLNALTKKYEALVNERKNSKNNYESLIEDLRQEISSLKDKSQKNEEKTQKAEENIQDLIQEKNEANLKISKLEREKANTYNLYCEEAKRSDRYSQREKELIEEISTLKSEKISTESYEDKIQTFKKTILDISEKLLLEKKKVHNLSWEKNEMVFKISELEKEIIKKDETNNQKVELEIKTLKEESSKLYKFYLEEIEKNNKHRQREKDLVQKLSTANCEKNEKTYKILEVEKENVELNKKINELIKKSELESQESEIDPLKEIKKEQINIMPSKNIKLYNEFKDNLIEAVKQFEPIDIKEIYRFAQEKKILKNDEKKLFNNVNVRMKFNMAINPSSLEELTEFYKKIVNLGYIDEVKENPNKSELKDFNAKEEKHGKDGENLETAKAEIDIDLKNLSVEQWFKLAEIYEKDKDYDPWLRRFIYSLANYKKKNGILTEKQIEVVKNKFIELGESLEKLAKIISKDENDKINEPIPKKPTSIREILESIRANEKSKVEEPEPTEELEIVTKEFEVEKIEVTFDNLLKKGLNQGYIESEELMKVDYDKETLIVDYYDALEELEARGIKINY